MNLKKKLFQGGKVTCPNNTNGIGFLANFSKHFSILIKRQQHLEPWFDSSFFCAAVVHHTLIKWYKKRKKPKSIDTLSRGEWERWRQSWEIVNWNDEYQELKAHDYHRWKTHRFNINRDRRLLLVCYKNLFWFPFWPHYGISQNSTLVFIWHLDVKY